MKCRFVIGGIVLLVCSQSHSQLYKPGSVPIAPLTSFGGNLRTSFTLSELMGTRVNFAVVNDPHIKGNPFYTESFSPSIIILKNGVGYSGLETRMNLATNDIHFKDSDSTELVAGKGIIRKLVFFQNIKSGFDTISFSSGYPAIEHNDENTFYEEIASGKITFLKLTTKVLSSVQSIAASPLDKQYVDLLAYYIYSANSGRIEKWHKGKDFMVEFWGDKKDVIQKFIEDNNLKCKSTGEIKKLIDYYNSL